MGLAVRSCGDLDQGIADHLRKLVGVLRVAAKKLARAGDVAVVERASHVKPDRLEVGGHAGSIAASGESRKANRALLVLLAFALVDELAVEALHAWCFAGAPRPLAGWARLGWHVSIALSLGWPAALAWATWATKGACPGSLPGTDSRLSRASSAPWPAQVRCERSTARSVADILLGAYLGALAGLAIVYPPSRAGLRWTLLAWELACVALAWWGLWRARGRAWGAAEVCLVVLVACESAVVIVGPFASDPFLRWWIGGCFYLAAWVAVCGVLARGTMTRSS